VQLSSTRCTLWTREEVEPVEELLVRIVAMLTKMAAR